MLVAAGRRSSGGRRTQLSRWPCAHAYTCDARAYACDAPCGARAQVDKAATMVAPRDLLLYHYYAGLVHIAFKQFKQVWALEACLHASPHARRMHTACTPHARRMHTACTPHAHRMHTACTPHAHRMHTACTPHAHRMHTACTPHARRMHACIHQAHPAHTPRARHAHPRRCRASSCAARRPARCCMRS